MSLRALLLDFDGVLADTEPLHLKMFREVLQDEGIELSREAYYEKYLGLDDASCFEAVFRNRGLELTASRRDRLIRLKNGRLLQSIRTAKPLLPGALRLLEGARGRFYLAVVSGALRSEVAMVLSQGGVRDDFQVLVTAEDVARGKPAPEGFLQAVRLLNRDHVPEAELLLPGECLAVEDSPWGIEAALAAGIPCAAVTTSYPEDRLRQARWFFPDVGKIDLGFLCREFDRVDVSS